MSDGHLKLCRDGEMKIVCSRISVKEGYSYRFELPVLQYEEAYLKNAFLKNIRKEFEMEEGLTLKELFQNLVPYQDLIEGLASIDFDGFYTEVHKEPDEDLSKKGAKLFVQPSAEFGKGLLNKSNYNFQFNVDSFIRYKGDDTNYSMMFIPTCNLANCQIEINKFVNIEELPLVDVDGEPNYSFSYDPEYLILNKDNPYLNKIAIDNIIEYDISFKEAIIDGLLYEIGFFYTPRQRDDEEKLLEEAQKDVEEGNTFELPKDENGELDFSVFSNVEYTEEDIDENEEKEVELFKLISWNYIADPINKRED